MYSYRHVGGCTYIFGLIRSSTHFSCAYRLGGAKTEADGQSKLWMERTMAGSAIRFTHHCVLCLVFSNETATLLPA